jgi:hypothetical protein
LIRSTSSSVIEDGAFPTAWRQAMATGFLSLFYLTFLPVVFFPGDDPLMPKSPKNDFNVTRSTSAWSASSQPKVATDQ